MLVSHRETSNLYYGVFSRSLVFLAMNLTTLRSGLPTTPIEPVFFSLRTQKSAKIPWPTRTLVFWMGSGLPISLG
jgi:hypothetical protein